MNEAELLFTDILNCDRVSLYLNKDIALDKDTTSFVSSALKRRFLGEPIQYILGKTEFMGLEFKVTPDVFIPRPETEILVETVLKIVSQSLDFAWDGYRDGEPAEPFASLPVSQLKILDIGTGSGCIAISLAKLLQNARVTAVDISDKALEIARENSRLNAVEVKFLKSDLFSNYELRTTNYELIVSNPPYIPTPEIKVLQNEVKHEPLTALDGGRDGLDFYRRIIGESARYLGERGYLIMEIGFNQKEAVKNILEGLQNFKIIECVKDYNNIDRVFVAQKTK